MLIVTATDENGKTLHKIVDAHTTKKDKGYLPLTRSCLGDVILLLKNHYHGKRFLNRVWEIGRDATTLVEEFSWPDS